MSEHFNVATNEAESLIKEAFAKGNGYRLRVKGLQHFSDPEPSGGGDPEPTPAGGELKFTLEHFQSFLDTNVDAQKVVQSRIDSAVSKGVESFKTKTMPGILQEEIAKRTEKTPQQIEMDEMKAEIEKIKQENAVKTIEAEVAKRADEFGIDAQVALDFCLTDTLDGTIEKVNKLNEFIEKAVKERTQLAVDERFKQNYVKRDNEVDLSSNTKGNFNSLDIIRQQIEK